MALFATHVRFAAACATQRGTDSTAENPEYYAGAIYPDSRYTTRTARELTHAMQQRVPGDTHYDLFRGVHTHLFYDEFSRVVYEQIFPEAQDIATNSETWELFTAAKILNDIESYQLLQQNNMLHVFELQYEFTHSVNGESVEVLNHFLQSIRNMYATPPTQETYIGMLDYFHIDSNVIRGVEKNVSGISSSPQQLQAIGEIFNNAVQKYSYE